MRRFKVSATPHKAGVLPWEYGIFPAETPEDALEQVARGLGYRSFANFCEPGVDPATCWSTDPGALPIDGIRRILVEDMGPVDAD